MTKPLRDPDAPEGRTHAGKMFPKLPPGHPLYRGGWFVGERRAPKPTPPKETEPCR
jgi:hypothetical protein